MKTYIGKRTIDGLVVTVDGAPLDDRMALKTYSDAGIEWGYPGAAPRQLALAILCDHLGDDQAALARSDDFMKRTVAVLDNDWQLTSAEIDRALGG